RRQYVRPLSRWSGIASQLHSQWPTTRLLSMRDAPKPRHPVIPGLVQPRRRRDGRWSPSEGDPRERADLTSIRCQVPPGPANDNVVSTAAELRRWRRRRFLDNCSASASVAALLTYPLV